MSPERSMLAAVLSVLFGVTRLMSRDGQPRFINICHISHMKLVGHSYGALAVCVLRTAGGAGRLAWRYRGSEQPCASGRHLYIVRPAMAAQEPASARKANNSGNRTDL